MTPDGQQRQTEESVRESVPDIDPVEADNFTDDTTSNAERQELADAVIPHLAVSSEYVAAVKDWANTNIEENYGNNVSAYAKVCGREWTYYVKRLNVRIGRPPDATARQGTSFGVESSPALDDDDSTAVHIDLGPNKLVSRLHAELFFNHEDSKWHVRVNGRNGARLNDIVLRRGQQRPIESGTVLEIAGTQLMFVAAEGQAVIHPMFLEKLQEEKLHEGEPSAPEPPKVDNHAHAHPPSWENGAVDSPSQVPSAARVGANGQPAIAPAPPDFVRPSTPTRPAKKAGKQSSSAKPSPALGRGIVMESSELLDYRSDSVKDIKPPLNYATLITQAILSTPQECLSLDGIYRWIRSNFSYYKHVESNWPVGCVFLG